MSIDEALRANFEKVFATGDEKTDRFNFMRRNGRYAADRIEALWEGWSRALFHLTTRQEVAPVAWVMRSGHGTFFRDGPIVPAENVGWRPLFDAPTGQTSDARDCPAQFFASGPDGSFFTDSAKYAELLIRNCGYDRDDWTITDLYAAMLEAGK